MKDGTNHLGEQQDALDIESERNAWRVEVLNGILPVAVLTLGVILANVIIGGGALRFVVPMCLAFASTLVGFIFRRLSFQARARLLLLGVGAAAIVTMTMVGYAPNSTLALASSVVIAAVLFGLPGAVVVGGICLVALVAVPQLIRVGLLVRSPYWPELVDAIRPAVEVRVALSFLGITATTAGAALFVLRRAEELTRRVASAYDALRAAQAEREKVQAEMAAREAAFREAQEVETLGRLAGTVVHDVGNASFVLRSSLSCLEREPLSEEGRAAVTDMASALKQIGDLMEALRPFRPRAGREPATLELGAAVQKAGDVLARLLPHNIGFSVEVQVRVVVRAAESQIHRLLANLVLNARDAMRDGGRLLVRVRQAPAGSLPSAGGIVAMDVVDTGIGMSDEVKACLFQPWFTTKGESGTGLGLASVRQVAEQAGGRVEVQSEAGRGTVVTVLWPAVAMPGEMSADGAGAGMTDEIS